MREKERERKREGERERKRECMDPVLESPPLIIYTEHHHRGDMAFLCHPHDLPAPEINTMPRASP